MNDAIIKALELAKMQRDDRLMPIILDLEQKESHQAMFWLIDILKVIVLKSKHDRTSIWISWIERLKRIAKDIESCTIEEMRILSKSIFNASSARSPYLNLISHAYVIEAIYKYREPEKYMNHLLHITIYIYDKFETSDFSIFNIALDIYKEYIEN